MAEPKNHLSAVDLHHPTNSEGLWTELGQSGVSSVASLESLIMDLMKTELDTAPLDEWRSPGTEELGVRLIKMKSLLQKGRGC